MSDTTPSCHDRLSRFIIEQAGVRGVHVHMADSWRQIVGRDDYPPAVAEMLGEATAAAALFTGHAKVDGRLSVQLRGNGALRTLFAECTAAGTLRGIAQVVEGAQPSRDLRELGPDALLAITIENPALGQREPMRYQGMVELSADNLASAFEDYFIQSEQLPTRLVLAVDGERCAGLMLQKLPGDEGDSDGWTRAGALFDTVVTGELLTLTAEELLTRLFHEDGVRMLGQRPLAFACSCSAERVESMLVSLGEEEARAAAAEGEAHIRCEFCGQQYRFSQEEIDRLFATRATSVEAPDRPQ